MVLTLSYLSSYGQQDYYVKSLSKEPSNNSTLELEAQRLDSSTLKKTIISLLESKRNEGYLLANLDQLIFKSDTAYISIYIGEKYKNIKLNNKNLRKEEVKTIALRWKHSEAQVAPQNLAKLFERIINHKQNSGYPFASVKLDSIIKIGSQISANILIDQGPLITFDSLQMPLDVTKSNFISGYLGIEFGAPFDQSKVDDIALKIRQLPYLKLISKPTVSFSLGKAQVNIDIESIPVNTFDGIAGFVPNQNGRGSELTGELKLKFDNLFQSGKKIDFEWQKLNSTSQFLDLTVKNPRLFNSSLNFNFNFNQVKEDTLFSNRSYSLGIDYNISPHINLLLSYENKNGNNLDATDIITGNFDINNYTLSLNWQHLDDIQYPKNGFQLRLASSVGSKESSALKNSTLTSQTSNQYQFSTQISFYKKVEKRSVFHSKISLGLIENQYLFLNDLFRIGGLNTLRGFNEKAFFASQYALINVEWRWLMSEASYFLLFADKALLKYNLDNVSFEDAPIGLGLGFKIKTKAGHFNLIYALGKTTEQNFSFNFSKLHFGYAATL